MRAHTTQPCGAERTTDAIVRRPGLMHLGICALLVACGGEGAMEPSDAVPTFTLVGRGILNQRGLTADLWVHGTVAYTGMFDLFGTGTAANTLWAWDVSNPATPVRAGSVVVDGVGSVGDVKIRADGTLGLITHQGPNDGLNYGVTLIDLSDPLQPSVITSISLAGGVHNAWIEGDYAYLVDNGSRGLRVLDISNPADPQVVAGFYAGSSVAHDVYVRDGLAFVSHWNAGLLILDVGNGIAGGSPTNPVEVGRVQTEGGNTHNAWYWPDAGYVFVGEESNRPGVLHVVDVSDLSNPVVVATFADSERNPHNFWLDEARGILYVAWTSQGLKAIDVSGELLGRLDTQGRLLGSIRVGVGRESFFSSWGAQLHEGLVYVSEVSSGLWIFRPEF